MCTNGGGAGQAALALRGIGGGTGQAAPVLGGVGGGNGGGDGGGQGGPELRGISEGAAQADPEWTYLLPGEDNLNDGCLRQGCTGRLKDDNLCSVCERQYQFVPNTGWRYRNALA
jgi:hypothetical protein